MGKKVSVTLTDEQVAAIEVAVVEQRGVPAEPKQAGSLKELLEH